MPFGVRKSSGKEPVGVGQGWFSVRYGDLTERSDAGRIGFGLAVLPHDMDRRLCAGLSDLTQHINRLCIDLHGSSVVRHCCSKGCAM